MLNRFTPLVSSSFTGVDEDPLSEGGVWTLPPGVNWFKRASNTAQPKDVAAGGDQSMYYSGITWPANQYVRGNITVTGTTGSGSGGGLLLRQASGAATFYRFCIDHAAANNASIFRFVAGVSAQLIQALVPFADGDQFTFAVSGTTPGNVNLLVFDKSGSLAMFVTDTAATAPMSGSGGLTYSSSETFVSLDNFEGGAFAFDVQPIDYSNFPKSPLNLKVHR